ncbi:MAG: primase, partial [Dehalococcoidales bacterium]|nr:primase [Dehalococcoidales bacterium]
GKDPDDVIREDAQSWQHLADNALPVIDYTLKIVTSKLDLTTARDKSAAVERLLPIVAQIADSIRQDHYLNQLSRLSGVTYSRLETALSRLKTTHQSKEPKPAPVIPVRHLLASPLEEYCLTLLLQHPELKNRSERLLPEYFESSANRTIFTAWQAAEDISSLRAQLDTAMWEYLDALLTKSIPGNQIEPKLDHCILDLRKESLRRLEAKRGAILALAAETGGTQAVLAKLEEQGIDVSIQLGEIFTQKARKGQ